jgi:hypothetical protein
LGYRYRTQEFVLMMTFLKSKSDSFKPKVARSGFAREPGEVAKIVAGTLCAVVLSGLAVMAWAI